ncbi:acyl-CoA dehydrogenase family protein [Myxococcota bacterium]|nr:acyl-CoA dehydrogenase family protein [Myxococcota bacterium]
MDFELTDGQRNVRDLLHWIAETKIRPRSLDADRAHRVPDDVLLELQELGITGGFTSTDGDGITGRGVKQASRTAVLAVEELAWGDASFVLAFPGPGLGGPPIRISGTPEQKERYFAPFQIKGELHWGAYGLTEPGAGSDVASLATTAVKDGHHYVLNGRKCYITNGARADWCVLFATVDRTLGRAGHRAFVVHRGTPGFAVGKIEQKLGLRASETAELVLDDCRVHVDDLLGGEAHYAAASSGFKTAMKTFDSTRPLVAAMAVGIGRAAFERAAAFAKEAYMLSRPLARHASIRELLGRTERRLHAARMMVWRAASMADEGVPNTAEASMAKAFAAEAALSATIDALEVMGAAGRHRDALVEKWFRDVKVYDIFEGTGQIQRIVIAKRLFDTLKTF